MAQCSNIILSSKKQTGKKTQASWLVCPMPHQEVVVCLPFFLSSSFFFFFFFFGGKSEASAANAAKSR